MVVLAAGALPATAAEVTTAPYEGFAIYSSAENGFVSVPDHPALDPTGAFTLEAWVTTDKTHTFFEPCMSIAGKGYTDNYFLGFCEDQLRSWVGGVLVETTQIEIPTSRWFHVAVTSNGSRRRHYIDGSLVTDAPETGVLSPNSKPFMIGRDPDYQAQFSGAIDEVRLWNRALSIEEIRDYSRFALQYEIDGLVAVWDFGANEFFNNHNGTIVGNIAGLTDPLGSCSNTSSRLCLADRFTVSVTWETNSDSGDASAVPPQSNDTGLFWFFAPDNWEVVVKVLDACVLNNRVWVFASASTDQGYTITVRDSLTGQSVEYSKPIGPPAPAITDTGALDVCNPF